MAVFALRGDFLHRGIHCDRVIAGVLGMGTVQGFQYSCALRAYLCRTLSAYNDRAHPIRLGDVVNGPDKVQIGLIIGMTLYIRKNKATTIIYRCDASNHYSYPQTWHPYVVTKLVPEKTVIWLHHHLYSRLRS